MTECMSPVSPVFHTKVTVIITLSTSYYTMKLREILSQMYLEVPFPLTNGGQQLRHASGC